MRKFFLAMCICLAVAMVVSTASAEELWDFHLRGHTEGLALGAIPPAGAYLINEMFFAASFKPYDNAGHVVGGTKLFAFVDIPTFLWVPGCKFLGADYAAAIEEPFDYTNLKISPLPSNLWAGSQWGVYNTVLIPIMLSWTLPCDFHVMGGFEVGLNDGTTSPGNRVISSYYPYGVESAYKPQNYPGTTTVGTSDPSVLNGVKHAQRYQRDGGIYAESSNNTYVFAPLFAVSWLHGPWNLTVFGEYDISTKDTTTNYQSADEISLDYTLAYTWHKWTIGLGAATENQLGNDKFASLDNATGTYTYRSQPGTKVSNYSIGPIIGYNFGPCDVTFIYNFAIGTKNDVGGDWFEARLLVPLGNPCPWWK